MMTLSEDERCRLIKGIGIAVMMIREHVLELRETDEMRAAHWDLLMQNLADSGCILTVEEENQDG